MCLSFLQISMNVQRAHTIVNKFVLTLLVPSPVHVEMATHSPAIGAAMVCSMFHNGLPMRVLCPIDYFWSPIVYCSA